MILEMECSRCEVSKTCPRSGASPVRVGSRTVKCRIIGGYGRKPLDAPAMSADTAARAAIDGPCRTIAEIPVADEDGTVSFFTEKIFSNAVLHEREKIGYQIDVMYPKSHT